MMVKKLRRDDCVFVIIDVQERFMPVLDAPEEVVQNIVKLANGVAVLDIPTILTEQHPKGIGKTVPEIMDSLATYSYFEKDSFSCFKDEAFKKKIKSLGKRQLLVVGIEAHICVSKTVLDALEEGYDVFVVADAVTSRALSNKDIALERMKTAGAIIESTEGALFSFIELSNDEEFKMIHRIIK
ncbi:MAG: hydrolase [Candidatus Methanofastidiosia archaeon]